MWKVPVTRASERSNFGLIHSTAQTGAARCLSSWRISPGKGIANPPSTKICFPARANLDLLQSYIPGVERVSPEKVEVIFFPE
jgi:hypothetical protein